MSWLIIRFGMSNKKHIVLPFVWLSPDFTLYTQQNCHETTIETVVMNWTIFLHAELFLHLFSPLKWPKILKHNLSKNWNHVWDHHRGCSKIGHKLRKITDSFKLVLKRYNSLSINSFVKEPSGYNVVAYRSFLQFESSFEMIQKPLSGSYQDIKWMVGGNNILRLAWFRFLRQTGTNRFAYFLSWLKWPIINIITSWLKRP